MKGSVNRRAFLKTAGLLGAAGLTAGITGSGKADDRSPSSGRPLPRPAQRAWQEAELGIVFHYDIHLFDEVRYDQGANRRTRFENPKIFSPSALDTDQWVRCAKDAGARFAILTASHETGFRMWQSDANPYCLKATGWGGGKRDLVGEFVASCRLAGIAPGIYLGARWNGMLGVLNFRVTERSPITQAAYNRLIEAEVEEIVSRYGPLFELWFDGGIAAPEAGGPDVLPLFEKHQPGGLFYHSDQRRDARWGGTESGTVGDPCWSTVDLPKIRTGMWNAEVKRLLRHGDPEGGDWCPAMADAPLRNHEWFWEPGDERKLYSREALVDMYYRSVGLNSTLILGAVPDRRGLVPEADARRMKELGDTIRARFDRPLAEVRPLEPGEELHAAARAKPGEHVTELSLPEPATVDHVIIQEDITRGERIRSFVIEARGTGDTWRQIFAAESVGQKRIARFGACETPAIRLRVTVSKGVPRIRRLAAFHCGSGS